MGSAYISFRSGRNGHNKKGCHNQVNKGWRTVVTLMANYIAVPKTNQII